MTDQNMPPENQAPEQSAQEQTFTKTEVQRILDEAKSYKAKVQEFEAKMKAKEVEELTANQKWKELAELKEREAAEASEKAEKLKSAIINKEKISAIKEAALQAGLRKESIPDLRLIDFPEVTLQNSSEGEFSVSGADKAIQRLKALRPHWFQSSIPSVNSSSPVVTGDGSSISFDNVKKLQDEYKKNPSAENADKYKNALLQFKKQAK
jgi:hypothetical protein